ncbi:unnamed protein product [Rotaria sp. Silwood1]|nr:unnamed protein product [Rotaria sp. Silwood1]
MAMYNSSSNNNQHENDITIINSLFSSDYNYEPTHVDISDQNTNDNRDYFFIEHDLQDKMKQIEQILSYYRQDLKQESNTQLDCDRNLITRLVDFIRPEYSSNKNKIKDLDILFNEILNLNEKRFIKQKEKKNEQVQKEIANLKKLIVTSANKDHITKNISQINSMIDYKVWMEIEEETRKLYNLVERQRNQINELIKLIPLQGQDSSFHDITAPISKPPIVKQQPAAYNANVGSTLVTRVRTLAGQQQYSGINDPSSSPQSTQYECPICKQRFSGNDDKAYREHLSDCYSESDARF